MAQLAEQLICNQQVIGSSPIIGFSFCLKRKLNLQQYKDFIINQLSFGGLNEDSVFDAWIDQFGYLTIVNLSKIFNDNTITYKNLVTRVTGGETTTASSTELPDNEVKLVNRVITNDKTSGIHNLRFDRYETIVNNEEQIKEAITQFTKPILEFWDRISKI